MNTKKLAISIGDAFRAARERLGLTIEDAADILGIGGWYLAGVEAGNGNQPSILLCHLAVDLLDADPEVLFGRHDYERQRMADNLEIARVQCRRAQDDRDAAVARAESLAAECDALQRELGRVRMERDAAIEEARLAHDRVDELEAERETLLLLAELRGEDPDVTEHPGQLRLELANDAPYATAATPAGRVIVGVRYNNGSLMAISGDCEVVP